MGREYVLMRNVLLPIYRPEWDGNMFNAYRFATNMSSRMGRGYVLIRNVLLPILCLPIYRP
jgi:hypothetical protein